MSARLSSPAIPGAVAAPVRGGTTPVRVLVLIAAASVEAGPVKGCFQFIRHLRGRELEFRCVNFRVGDDDPRARAFAAAAADAGIEVGFVTQNGRGYAAIARSLAELAQREGIDVVQSHGFKPAVMCAWLRLRHGLPWVCFCHGATAENWRVRLYHGVEDLVRRFADRVVLVADAQRERGWLRPPARRTRVIRNAVDMEAPARGAAPIAEVRRSLRLAAADRLAVVVGRLSPEKGVDVAIDALARLVDAGAGGSLHLAIVGDGPQRAALASRVERLGLGTRVHFVGHTTTPGDYLRAADMVLLPSRSEGIPNVALEAMALGRPLVATAVGGTPEVVADDRAGMLIPPDDAGTLAAAVHRLLAEPDLAARLSAGARAHAAAELTVAVRCERLRAVYTELVPRLAAMACPAGGSGS